MDLSLPAHNFFSKPLTFYGRIATGVAVALGLISADRKSSEVTVQMPAPLEVLVQATGWRRNAQSKVELIAAESPTYVQQPLTCAAVKRNQ